MFQHALDRPTIISPTVLLLPILRLPRGANSTALLTSPQDQHTLFGLARFRSEPNCRAAGRLLEGRELIARRRPR